MCRDMQRRGASNAGSKRHDWTISCMASQFIKCRKRRRPDPGKPRGTGATAESGIIYSPNFDCTLAPHLGLFKGPTLRAICIPIKPQNVNVGTALKSCRLGLRNPYFQLSIFEWDSFSNGAACINRRPGWKQNKVVGQMTEKHHDQIYDRDRE